MHYQCKEFQRLLLLARAASGYATLTMKTLALAALVLASLTPLTLAGGLVEHCKGTPFLDAIYKFCAKDDIYIPSHYAQYVSPLQETPSIRHFKGNHPSLTHVRRKGMHGGEHNGAFVKIVGFCDPPQWVPQGYCSSQL